MTIEETVFQRKAFRPDRLRAFGFREENGTWTYETDILDGAFRVSLRVDRHSQVTGRVLDTMNDEEYLALRNERFDGAYVNSVRFAYEEVLRKIAAECCGDVLFSSEQARRITGAIQDRYGVIPEFPWTRDAVKSAGVFRHRENRKWFGIIMPVRRDRISGATGTQTVDVMNLKVRPDQTEKALGTDGIYPAYHMNKKNWISVILDDTLADGTLWEWIENSFSLTAGR